MLWSHGRIAYVQRSPSNLTVFGVTGCGTTSSACRGAVPPLPLLFLSIGLRSVRIPVDSYVLPNVSWDPDSLIEKIVTLTTPSETDLGFNPNINRTRDDGLDLQFNIQGAVYDISQLPYQVTPCGRGTWVFSFATRFSNLDLSGGWLSSSALTTNLKEFSPTIL